MLVSDVAVVICTLNEEKRIEDCLRSVVSNNPGEIIVVDGGSIDRTVEIAKKYTNKVIISNNSNLTRDRQIGINAATKNFIAMIDSDHHLEQNSLQLLLNDMDEYDFDIVQSQLIFSLSSINLRQNSTVRLRLRLNESSLKAN